MSGLSRGDGQSQARDCHLAAPFTGQAMGPQRSSFGPTLSEEFDYVAPAVRPYPRPLRWLQEHLFCVFLLLTFLGTPTFLLIAYFVMGDRHSWCVFLPCNVRWKGWLKYLSIPLVSVAFTWWHVWLGIQMCFYPIEFIGCCRPYLGWQGIVPRRSHVMASRSCDIMIGTIITVEEIIDRVEPKDFFENLRDVLGVTSAAVLDRLANRSWPDLWARLSDSVKAELQHKVLEESQKMFSPVVRDLKANINQIVDIKQMSIDILKENKLLLVQMFQKIGHREFVFIQHVAAVMGLILGIFQMFLWLLLDISGWQGSWAGFVVLPISGMTIGYFTNWLAITMIFRPVEPHITCFGYVNIQGVFLKRQQEVSVELTTMICKHLVHARRMMEYIVQNPDIMERVLEIYQRHVHSAIDEVLGRARIVMPILVGRDAINGIKQEVIQETLAELPNHSAEIEAYMDRAFRLQETLSFRLSRLPPSRFEGMLHPVFQEDEWMVLLLGGVLGVLVGLLQALALGS
mmetsp:Transcript_34501/g.75299  ORF Transcript_34501/g.75299 Transcript_34501/m.75299 type:complete len:514 (+) Transcript_34501:46-1587(+)